MVGSAPAMGGAWAAPSFGSTTLRRKPVASRNQSAIHVSVKGDDRAWKDGTEVTR